MAGHVSLKLLGGEILTGDALLPQYTPNVGGADVRLEWPLERYRDTLERLAEGGYAMAWPGHREPIDEPMERVRAVVRYHEERAYRVVSHLNDREEAMAWEVATALFGELQGIHVLHGPGEAYAHLDHLSREGTLERDSRRFRLRDRGYNRFAARRSRTWPLE